MIVQMRLYEQQFYLPVWVGVLVTPMYELHPKPIA